MKSLLRVIAMALVIFGTIWALQGLGILMWPPQGFMLAQREWGVYGALLAGFGVLVWVISGRFDPRR